MFLISCLVLAIIFGGTQGVARSGLLQFGQGNDTSLPKGDDNIARIRLPSQFTFYGTSYSDIFVLTNGAISLGDESSTLVAISFPQEDMDVPLVAPFFADVDTRGVGNIYYRQSNSVADLNFANDKIRRVSPNFSASQVFVATWDSVGYYEEKSDKNNTFQCILSWNSNQYFVIFLYVEDLLWTTGDINGGTNGLGGNEAQAGFNSGDGLLSFSLPGSQTQDVLNLDSTSNIKQPGVWVFRVDGNITNTTVIDCGQLPDIANGTVTYSSGVTTFGSMAVYSCSIGFTLNGMSIRTCQDNGSWSGIEPSCTPANCGSPDLPSDTSTINVSTTFTDFGGIATYSCEEGYIIVGNATRTCQSNSTWSGTVPSCNLVICNKDLLSPLNRTALTINAPRLTFDNEVTYTCSTGYVLRGSVMRTCQANGNWSSTPPYCEFVNCGRPDLPQSNQATQVNFTGVFLGSGATYFCLEGYILNGDSNRTCTESGQWSGTPPECMPIDCGNPESSSFTNDTDISVSTTVTTFNGVATYSCVEEGMTIVGRNIRRCGADGNWTDTTPTECTSVDCGEPELPSSGFGGLVINYDNTTFDNIANYSCPDDDLTLVGDSARTCQADGSWSGEPPFCRRRTRLFVIGLSVGLTIGIILLLLLLLLILLLCCCCCCRGVKSESENTNKKKKAEVDYIATNDNVYDTELPEKRTNYTDDNDGLKESRVDSATPPPVFRAEKTSSPVLLPVNDRPLFQQPPSPKKVEKTESPPLLSVIDQPLLQQPTPEKSQPQPTVPLPPRARPKAESPVPLPVNDQPLFQPPKPIKTPQKGQPQPIAPLAPRARPKGVQPKESKQEDMSFDEPLLPYEEDPFEGIDEKDIDSVHDFKLHYLNDDNQSIASDKNHYII